MRKAAKIWLVAAALLVVLGLAVFTAAMTAGGWDFSLLDTKTYETKTHEIHEEFSRISIETNTADVVFVPADDGACTVVCREEENLRHSVVVQDGTLVIKAEDTREWHDHISLISFDGPKITVYLPGTEYSGLFIETSTGDIEIPAEFSFESVDILTETGDASCYASAAEGIQIKADTGYIRVENVTAGALDLSVSTGDVTVSGVTCAGEVKVKVSTGKTDLADVVCGAVVSSGNTGDISLKSVIAEGRIFIERSTGDVTFEQCDAGEIFVATDTGDVTGSLLSDKVFLTETDTGDVSVPKSTEGGPCEIKTDTGDIDLRINR